MTQICCHFSAKCDVYKLVLYLVFRRVNLSFRNVSWEPVNATAKNMNYLNIDAIPKMIPEPFTNRIKFWDSLNLINA